MYFVLYTYSETLKTAFCLKRGILLDLKISDFGWKGYFFSKICERCVFSTLGTSMDVRFGRAWGVVGVGVLWGSGGQVGGCVVGGWMLGWGLGGGGGDWTNTFINS